MAGPSHVNCHRPRPLATLHEKSPRFGQLLTCIVARIQTPFQFTLRGQRPFATRYPFVKSPFATSRSDTRLWLLKARARRFVKVRLSSTSKREDLQSSRLQLGQAQHLCVWPLRGAECRNANQNSVVYPDTPRLQSRAASFRSLPAAAAAQ